MSKSHSVVITFALIASLGMSPLYVMANPGNGNGYGHDKSAGYGNEKERSEKNKQYQPNTNGLVSVSLSYERARSLAVTYGLTGYQSLPPGIAKNLARGKPLPPGIAKKMVPASMLGQLPAYPGYEWRIAGDNLILVALGSALVASVINKVFY